MAHFENISCEEPRQSQDEVRESLHERQRKNTFADAGHYAAAIRGVAVEVTVTAGGELAAKRTRIDFHRLWMQRFSENFPRVLQAALLDVDPQAHPSRQFSFDR